MGILGFGSSTEEKSKASKFTWIPERDADVDDIGREVSDSWQELREEYGIKDKSPDKMLENCTLYHSDRVSIDQIELGGGTRKERWSELEEKVARGKYQVVSYLKFVYPGKDIRVHLSDFGYEPKQGGKRFPMSQAEMGKAIDQMIVGVKFHGMQKAPIGLKFWEETQAEYNDIMGIKDKKKRDKKPLITEKNILKAEIQRYLRAIKKHLEAVYDNSQEELETELLKWGYKKIFR